MRLLLISMILLASTIPALAVPLTEWEADKAKLLGEEPVTRADLPDEWQGMNDEELRELIEEVYAEAEEHYYAREYQQALPGYQQYLYLARAIDDLNKASTGLSHIGRFYVHLGQYEQALVYLEQCRAIDREIGDTYGEGASLNNIGLVYRNLGQYEQALEYFEQSLAIDREIGCVFGEGISLNNIANAYYRLEQYEQALKYYEQTLAIRREIGDIRGEGISLGDIGNVYNDQGHYTKALECFEQSLAIHHETRNVRGEGAMLNYIGGVYDDLGQYEEALEYYEQSLDIFRETGDTQGEGASLNNIGIVYDDLGQYQQALECYEQSLDIDREIGDIKGEGASLNNIGIVYDDLGQYEQALECYGQSLAIKREIGDIKGEGASLNSIGGVYSDLGQYEQALEYYEQSLTIDREIGDIKGEGISLNSISGVYWQLGQYEQALECLEQSLAIAREIGYIQGEGSMLGNIGNVYWHLGQYERALEYLEQSLAIYRETGGVRGQGRLLNNIGIVYEDLRQYKRALEYYEQSLAIAREIGDIQGEGRSLMGIGIVYKSLGQYQQALKYYEQSLAINREIGNVPSEGISLNNIGLLYADLGQYEQALEPYSQAFEIARTQATQFTWESGLKGGLVEELSKDATNLAETQLKLDQAEDAFATVQSAKGVPLLQLLAQAQVQVEDPQAQAALSAYRNANAALQKYRKQRRDVAEDDEEQRAYINERIDEWQAKANDAWDYLREHAPEITDIIEVKGLTVEQVQDEVLDEGQVVLEYMVTDDDIVVFCLPKEGELTVAHAEMPDLGELEFKDWLGRRIELLYANQYQISDQAAKTLYRLLIEPVEDQVPPGAELIICPDRELFIVPFEALLDDEFLLDRHSITYSTSATMLSYIKPSGGAEGALVAGVSFGAGEKEQSSLLDQRSADLVRGHLFAENLPPLPGVIDETKEIAAIYGSEPLLDEQVTEALLREMMPGHEVIHLATHGYLSDIPLMNGIVTYLPSSGEVSSDRDVPMLPSGDDDLPRDVPMLPAGDDDLRGDDFTINTNDDGFLTMAEVMGIPLAGCELVTLSACHSAEGGIAPGEGVMGLSQGFMFAGARSILASLTKVEDTATKLLMVEFYQNWNGGMSKREALRAAKQMMIESGYEAPKYWAPFVLYGVE